jgi:hypothetical protein
MVSFDIVSLFTRVPIKETTYLLGSHLEGDVLGLFCHDLTTANIYMEGYEKVALESPPPPKLRCWFRYFDGIFIIWPQGPNSKTSYTT